MIPTTNERPTPAQCRAIAKLARILKIKNPIEETVKTREEAQRVQWNLLKQVRAKQKPDWREDYFR